MTAQLERIKRTIRARYDRFAANELEGREAFEPVGRAKAYFRRRKLTTALELGGFPPGSRLLDVGCSVGQYAIPLAQAGYHVVGVDLSPNSVAVAGQRAASLGIPGVTFSVDDAETLAGCADNAFDGVVSFSALRYVPQLATALSGIYRVLKPGARAVVDFPNRWCPWFYLKPWLGSERHPHDHWFDAATVRRLVSEAGFRDIRIRHLLFTPTVTPDPLIGVFAGLDWVGERLPLVRRLAGIIMVAATKP